MTSPSAVPFVIASANFGGGARAIPSTSSNPLSRPQSLANFLSALATSQNESVPLMANIQEMTRLLDPMEDHCHELQYHLARLNPTLFYAPTVTTDWYPLPQKWAARWQEGIKQMEQGMATVALNTATLSDPELKTNHSGLIIPLPAVEFTDSPEEGDCLQQLTLPHDGRSFFYRHTRYLGNRDTEPRAATAHRVRLTASSSLEFILINVHLGTLKEENQPGNIRVNRVPTDRATALRFLQLDVVQHFVNDVYQSLKLPVIVAGDFNASPVSPEMSWFLEKTGMKATFENDVNQCWNCGMDREDAVPETFFAHPDYNSILSGSKADFANLLPNASPSAIECKEWCRSCQVPLFSHKRNFTLIDNILYTPASTSEANDLSVNLSPIDQKGIELAPHFSDHLPIWSRFNIEPNKS